MVSPIYQEDPRRFEPVVEKRSSPSSSTLPPSSCPPSISPSPTATIVLDPPLDSKDDQNDTGGLENAGDLEEETFGAEEGREKRGVGEEEEKWEFEQHPDCPYNLSLGEFSGRLDRPTRIR